MSGICSKHQHKEEGCELCEAMPWHVLKTTEAEYKAKVDEAKSRGTARCSCGFVFYLTVDSCPACGRREYLIL